MKADLPPDVRRFLLTSVPSVPYLEALLLLRENAAVAWQPPLLAARLYLPERQGGDLLRALAEAGIAAEQGAGFRYQPRAELTPLLDDVAQAYAGNLLGVTALIHSRIDKRAHQFADAFRIRKGDNR